MEKIERQAISAIRVLAAETVQKANSGHPGLPLGAAPVGYALFSKHLRVSPKNPSFFNRDRFVLSAGHGSALLYTLFHVFNMGVTKEDLMGFRQLKTRTPGHPEYGHTPFVETTTGPLGQGYANAVGFALAETMLAAKFNKPGLDLVDHYTYALCGDGCMQEGISYEAGSLAGTWGLNKLIVIYDSNGITIEGDTDLAFTEDVAKRHEAMGWQVLNVDDGEDTEAISAAITLAKKDLNRPSLIVVRTVIGYGSPKAGTADSHGAPLGEDGVKALKKALGYTAKPFELPPDLVKHYAELSADMAKYENEWNRTVKSYKTKYPAEYEEFTAWVRGKAPELADVPELWKWPDKPEATRNTSGVILNKLSDLIPNLVGGSADLSPSNKTYMKDKGDYGWQTPEGRNLHFGVREHAMAAITNGLALHGGLIPFCATFFVFSDYMKNAMRLSALMRLPVLYVMTHDSIGVGEDGPTHQPVEQLVALRSIPNMRVFRPCDGRETAAAYAAALSGKGPACIIGTRQNLPPYKGTGKDALAGGYILDDCADVPNLILMASGSEVEVAVKAKQLIVAANPGLRVRVVSMPCMELFEEQTQKYRESVLPSGVRARIAIEAGSSYSWGKYAGLDGGYVCMDTFGASAPAEQLFTIYGFTPENVAAVAKKVLRNLSKAEKSENGSADV
ncbi:MAG: transketolase [Clostridiales bacterium]|jgi:transketolase|nr:transketolase [Clostridiales bacterium]